MDDEAELGDEDDDDGDDDEKCVDGSLDIPTWDSDIMITSAPLMHPSRCHEGSEK